MSFKWQRFPWVDSEFARARWMYVVGMLYLLLGYLGTNEIAALNPWHRPALPIATVWDASLPFVPWTVMFYTMYFPLLATPLFLAPSPAAITRLTIAQAGMNTIAYVVFLVFPTPIDRPAAHPVEGIFHILLDTLFRADHPYNTFPSLHVAQSCLLALFYMSYSAHLCIGPQNQSAGRKNRFAVRVFSFHTAAGLLIAASAVLIKQHYIADAMSGALLAAGAYRLIFKSNSRSNGSSPLKSLR